MTEPQTAEQKLSELGWFTKKVRPKKPGMYRTTRMDLVESNNAGGAYSHWDGKKWGPAKSESGAYWGDYSQCSNMLWAKPDTPFVTLKEINGAVGSAATDELHRGTPLERGLPEPSRSDEGIRDLNAPGIDRPAIVPQAEPKGDALQPAQQTVRAPNVIVSDYLAALLLTGLYGNSLAEVEDRLICDGIARAVSGGLIPRRKPAGYAYQPDSDA